MVLWDLITNPYWMMGVFCLGCAVISYGIALRSLELSTAYPIMTTSVVVLVSIFSIFVFQEQYTLIKAIGTVIVICGVMLLSL